MFKRSICIIAGIMLIFTFSFGGVVKPKNVPAKSTKTTASKKSTKKTASPPKTSTIKKQAPAKAASKTQTIVPKTTVTETAKEQPKDIKQEVANTLNKYLNKDSFSGYAIVSENNSIIFEKGFGKSDFKKGTDHSNTTKYGIASITKQFTSFAIMQLEEKNALKVEDHINKYLPYFPYGNKITIHQLLTHTSGLPEHPLDFDITQYRPQNNKESSKANNDKVKLLFEPGSSFQYSNTGYILLGYIIEKVSGKSLDEYFKENIFEPLDMKNTGFNNEKNDLENKATGYFTMNKDESGPSWTDINVGYVRGSSGLYSTPEDLLKWETALNDGKLISNKSYKKMYTPYQNQYGYGWYINNELKDAPSYFHYGVAGDYRTYVYRKPSDKLIIILISNFGDYDMSFVAGRLDSAIN